MKHWLSKVRQAGLVIGVVLAGLSAGVVMAAEKMPKEKVVFQVSEANPKSWGLTLNNAKNVQDAIGKENVEVEIVVYGPGIGMVKFDSPMNDRIAEAADSGVKVVACENTMKAQGLKHEDMLAKVGFVPAGVVELMRKQQQGYAYIRP